MNMKLQNKNYDVKWDAMDILVAFMLMLIASVIAFPIFRLINILPAIVSKDFSFVLVLGTGILYLIKKYPINIHDYGFNKVALKKTLFWGIAGGVLLALLNMPIRHVIGDSVRNEYDNLSDIGKNHLLPIYLVSSILIIPILEEILFRGCIYRILKNRFDVYWATGITCVIFALGHLSVSAALYSLILVFVYEKSKCLGASIVAHIMWNATWYLSLLIFNF